LLIEIGGSEKLLDRLETWMLPVCRCAAYGALRLRRARRQYAEGG